MFPSHSIVCSSKCRAKIAATLATARTATNKQVADSECRKAYAREHAYWMAAYDLGSKEGYGLATEYLAFRHTEIRLRNFGATVYTPKQ